MNLASRIDHTILKPEATLADVQRLADEAKAHGFASVCANPIFAAALSRMLAGSPVKTCCVVGFPFGAAKSTVKAIEATVAVKDGAEEVDVVAHLPLLLERNLPGVKAELLEINKSARAANSRVVIKVIVESTLLMQGVSPDEAESRIALACRAVRESGADFIKTSTGYHPAGGASIEAVRLMKKHSQGLYVKASGGIRTYADAKAMLDAGADRLGCSASLAILSGAPNP